MNNIIPALSAESIQNAVKKNAENLKAGDIFNFRDKLYVSLSNFTDSRHTQTVITAVCQKNTVTAFRFFRTYKVSVVDKVDIKLQVLSNEKNEITPEDIAELEKIRGAC